MKIEDLKSVQKSINRQLVDYVTGKEKSSLSSSALSTAVAVVALAKAENREYSKLINSGIEWMIKNGNSDGGWGDTPNSKSNLSTTLLCWSALNFSSLKDSSTKDCIKRSENYIIEKTGSLNPEQIADSIINHYGKDKTFSVPILMLCGLSGRLGTPDECWEKIPQLPFELAALPPKLYSILNLKVVSYALPALIAIGLGVFKNRNKKRGVRYFIRAGLVKRVLKIISTIQPDNGGYLEAVPLTGFVAMSLISAGFKNITSVNRCLDFLKASVRKDGSWAIDSNLDTWVTTLTLNNILPFTPSTFSSHNLEYILDWLLDQQFKIQHPFTGAAAGGWGWTDLPGGVPDADDTAGALLALKNLKEISHKIPSEAVKKGIKWLIDIQNSDGGVPTFCKGWGKLPFDRSCPDITAHALRAVRAWEDSLGEKLLKTSERFIKNCELYLKNNQRSDGAWLPLWFGNQWNRDHQNPVYGTSQVLLALCDGNYREMTAPACNYLIANQNSDGGWGNNGSGASTYEETGLALSALIECGVKGETIFRASQWVIKNRDSVKAAPIGLYFASLWYHEKLYPYIFIGGAVNRLLKYYREDYTENEETPICQTVR